MGAFIGDAEEAVNRELAALQGESRGMIEESQRQGGKKELKRVP